VLNIQRNQANRNAFRERERLHYVGKICLLSNPARIQTSRPTFVGRRLPGALERTEYLPSSSGISSIFINSGLRMLPASGLTVLTKFWQVRIQSKASRCGGKTKLIDANIFYALIDTPLAVSVTGPSNRNVCVGDANSEKLLQRTP